MAEGLGLTFTLDRATAKIFLKIAERFDTKELYKLLLELFAKVSTKAAAFVTQTQLSGKPGLRRRTGSLARSIVGRSMMVNGMPAFRVGVFRGPARAYAGILERGGTILPKKAKSLAMPVGDALTPAGVARWPGPRQYPGTLKFIPFRSSGVAIGCLVDAKFVKRLNKKAGLNKSQTIAGLRVLYILLKRAKIPAFRYLRNGLRNYLPYVASELAAFLKQWVTSATKS